jgi:uncharacterized membrane protein
MADDMDVWMYNPSFALAVIGTIVYGLIFIAITYLTFFRYRAWYFTVVVVGAAVEVAGYVLRAYSAKNRTILVNSDARCKHQRPQLCGNLTRDS